MSRRRRTTPQVDTAAVAQALEEDIRAGRVERLPNGWRGVPERPAPRVRHPVPTLDEMRPNEFLVHLRTEPDEFGFAQFAVFWLDATKPEGACGQVYRAHLDEFTQRETERGKAIRVWTPPTT